MNHCSLLTAAEAELPNSVTLKADSRYELFNGDFEIVFNIPRESNLSSLGGGYIELVTADSGARIVGLGVPPAGIPTGTLTIDCGKLDQSGVVKGRLLDRVNGRTVIAETQPIHFVWPSDPPVVRMTFPDNFEALTDDIELELIVNEELHCQSSRQGAYYTLELAYLGPNSNDDGASAKEAFATRQVIATQKFPNLNRVRSRVRYKCRQIDQAGVYRAYFVYGGDPRNPIAASNPVNVVWSSAYSLKAVGDVPSILPCVGQFEVQYTRPTCSGNDDKIQLYRVKSRRVVDVEAADLVYITEKRALGPSPSTVSFGCRDFRSNVTAYCFKYLSTADNGAVHGQKLLCLPTAVYPGMSINGNILKTHFTYSLPLFIVMGHVEESGEQPNKWRARKK